MSLSSARDNPTPSVTSQRPGSAERKRRSAKACTGCHTRKVRCNVGEVGFPCTGCKQNGFECIAHERKKRARNVPEPRGGEGAVDAMPVRHESSVPEHMMLHLLPHYPFFSKFTPSGQPWLQSKDKDSGVLLPIAARDQSSGPRTGLSDDDLHFLRRKGAFALPPRPIMDDCISAYFEIFHPFFPIVDKPRFLSVYRESDDEKLLSGRGLSLLLLQAIIFTASATVPMQSLIQLGFSSRKQARSAFHQRARLLHNFDYEKDDVTTIQSLLLMSHYYPSMVEQKHTWLWAHQAISLAQGAGLHRDSGQVPQRKLWSRIWWACLARDRLIALGTGRPMHINSLDCNVPPLSDLDLEEDGDTEEDRRTKAIFVEFVRLCQYTEGVLSLSLIPPSSAASQIQLCDETLQHWLLNLVPEAQRVPLAARSNEVGSKSHMYKSVLHLLYNTVVMALRQAGQPATTTTTGAQATGPRLPPPEMQHIAEDSTSVMAELCVLKLIPLCPTICVTAVLPPTLVHLHMMRSGDNLSQNGSRAAFDTCMKFLRELGDVYWHASFYHNFLELAVANGRPGPKKHATPSPATHRHSSKRLKTRLVQDGQPDGAVSKKTLTSDDNASDDNERLQGTSPSSAVPLPTAFLGTTVNFEGGRGYDTSSPGEEAPGWDDQNVRLFDEWLNDYDLFQSMFPSA